jgi:hypothetical protein
MTLLSANDPSPLLAGEERFKALKVLLLPVYELLMLLDLPLLPSNLIL